MSSWICQKFPADGLTMLNPLIPPGSSCRERIENCRNGGSINWRSGTTQSSCGKCEGRALSPQTRACMVLTFKIFKLVFHCVLELASSFLFLSKSVHCDFVLLYQYIYLPDILCELLRQNCLRSIFSIYSTHQFSRRR